MNTKFLTVVLAAGLQFCAMSGRADQPISIGVNHTDLFTQYLGTASSGHGTPAERRVMVAMARKSIADARSAGVRYMRIMASGYFPVRYGQPGDLDLWQKDPAGYWQIYDQMMSDLQAAGMRIVPVFAFNIGQFPAMTHETWGDLLKNQDSASWKLFARYVNEFVTRYRSSPNIEFYEMANELNLLADLDQVKACKGSAEQCAVISNYTTDDMIAFTNRVATLVKGIDPNHLISTGFAVPRIGAEHLRKKPQWAPGGPDWTKDSFQEFEKNLRDVNYHADVICVHLYTGPENVRFGAKPGEEYKLVEAVKKAADDIGKPLWIGEFGDRDAWKVNADNSFTAKMLDEIVSLKVPYSAVWTWEFYQFATNRTLDSDPSSFSLEQGYTDGLIAKLAAANRKLAGSAASAPAPSTTPRVVLTWPLPCAVYKGKEELYAIASDDGGSPLDVEFLVNGKSVGHVAAPPYKLAFDAQSAPGGVASFEARACDAAKHCSSYQSNVVMQDAGKGASCAVGN
jgi:hypothetical protein